MHSVRCTLDGASFRLYNVACAVLQSTVLNVLCSYSVQRNLHSASVYSVRCTLLSVLCQCIFYNAWLNVLCSMCSAAQCTLRDVLRSMCSVQNVLFIAMLCDQCPLLSMLCKMCSVQCLMCSVRCALYDASMHYVPCTVLDVLVECACFKVLCTVPSAQWILFDALYTMCSAQCASLSVLCSMHSDQCTLLVQWFQ